MGFLKKRLKTFKRPDFTRSIKFQLLMSILIFFLLLRMTYIFKVYNFEYSYEVGDIVTEKIILNQPYYDEEATLKLIESVPYNVEPIYTVDSSFYAKSKNQIGEFFLKAYEIRDEHQENSALREDFITYVLRNQMGLSEEELSYLSRVDDYDLRLSESYIYDILQRILGQGVTSDNIIQKKNSVFNQVSELDQLPEEMWPVIEKIVKHHIVVNSYVDEKATGALIQEEKNEIEDVMISEGTVLLDQGQVLDEKTFMIINNLNLNKQNTWEQKLPLYRLDLRIILVLTIMFGVLNILYRKSKIIIPGKYIYLNFSILSFVYLLGFGTHAFSLYLLLIPTAAMLISVLNDALMGFLFSFFLSIIMGFILDFPIEILLFTMIASMVSALMVDKVYQRGRIFLAGIMVSIIYGIMILSDASISTVDMATIFTNLSFGLSSGILCSIITIGSLPLWEIIFKILTPIKLLEYANPNHPLMKKMLLEAPGTYHHSILVANLSEAAAHEINCNTFLTRVGAYFHDIGKIEKPYFYIENQYDGHNPHDEFVPMVSAKIIKDHVIKGIQMGKKYRLPKEIIEFIEQHHGTTQIQYFYQKALEFEEEDVIDHSLYTYEGPMPSTKEIAIVMLADSVEAAVRSLKKPNQRMISDLIEKIIQKKIGGGQLNNSGLTLSEIQAIQSSFVANLTSAFHERIEYPTERKDTHINRVK